jgi:predicted permease
MTRPPRLAAWLLGRRVWPGEREVILGDLEEQFHQRSAVAGAPRAQLWYWGHSLRLGWALHAPVLSIPSSRRSLAMTRDDIRYAIRRLTKRPASTVASIVTLAAAIGAAAATWSLLSATLLRPLPVASPEELVVIGFSYPSRDGRATAPRWSNTYMFYPVVRGSGAFEELAIAGEQPLMVATTGYPEARSVYFASHDYFDTLGVRPALGREFSEAEDTREGPLVAVLSDRLWRSSFNADPAVLGRRIRVEDKTAVIVGVAPGRFRGLDLTKAPDLYLPLHTVGQIVPERNPFAEPIGNPPRMSSPSTWLTFVGRLTAGSSDERAAEQLRARMPDLAAKGISPALLDVTTAALPSMTRAAMVQFTRLLAITVGLLLLIGCLSVGMLVLLGTEARSDELAMCLALGASRLRLARGIILEGALLSSAGALLAPFVALLVFGGLRQFQLPGRLEIDLLDLSIDMPVLLAAAASAVAATLCIAIVAGAFGFTSNLADVLRSRAGATPRVARRRTRLLLVGAQVAIAFVLLAGAGLFSRSISAALQLNPGFDTSRIVTGTISLARHGYTPPRATAFFDELRTRLQQHPGVDSVAFDVWDGGMSPGGRVIVDDAPRQFPSLVNYTYIDERYFSTVGQRVSRGRDLSSSDTAAAPRVTIVSESFGRLLANGGDPLGLRIKDLSAGEDVEVVGVVPDVITNVQVLEPLVMYMPLYQLRLNTTRRLVLRTDGDPAAIVRDAIRITKEIDPAVSAPALYTIDDQLKRQMGPQQFGAAVMGALGVIAAILTLLGTYVLAESMTVIRRREMGIRAALGATRRQLGSSVLRESTILVGAGLVVGLALAWLGASTIRTFLFQVQPLDAVTLAGVAVMMLALALAVSLRPAINATRVDLAKLLKDS